MEEVICSYCSRAYSRPHKRVNEAIKFGWKQYCSPDCKYKAATKAKEYRCGNPICNKTFLRSPCEVSISGIYFCSNSCAAKINNPKRVLDRKRPLIELKYIRKWKECLRCGNKFYGAHKKYCSKECSESTKGFSLEEKTARVINRIKKFYKENNRVPVKREMWGIYGGARRIFGSWNKAIIAAGFKPNPVRFAEKHIANDGHKCDSLAEKIIDDWLFTRNIPHETKVSYEGTKMTADFKIGNTLVEFFGLEGEVEKYDRNVQEKEKIVKERNLSLIKIYPEHLFPRIQLDDMLGSFNPL